MTVNINDAGFIFEEVWGARCALSGSTNDRLTLTRWNPALPASFENLICLTKKEARKHAQLKIEEFSNVYSPEFLDEVNSRFKRLEHLMKWRV